MNQQTHSIQLPVRGRVFLSAAALSLSLTGTSLYAAQEEGQQEPQERERQTATQNREAEQTLQLHGVYKADQLLGKSVKNPDGEDLGKIDELVINEAGKIKYAVLAHSGVFGIGADMTAVSWELLQLSPDADHYILNLELSEEQLVDLPTFSRNHWPREAQLTEASTFKIKEKKEKIDQQNE